MGIKARIGALLRQRGPVREPLLWHLTPDRAPEWRAIRLAALADTPEAFDSPVDDPAHRCLDDCALRLAQAETWAAGDVAGAPLAIAAWEQGWTPGTETMGWITGVYALPEARGRGLISALLARIADRAEAAGMDRLGLRVALANTVAQRRYTAEGFIPLGAPFVNDLGVVEIDMQRVLRPRGRAV